MGAKGVGGREGRRVGVLGKESVSVSVRWLVGRIGFDDSGELEKVVEFGGGKREYGRLDASGL